MTPDQALAMLPSLLEQLESESKTTRRVLAAVPVDKGDYRPDPVSKTADELSWHIASAEAFFLNSVADGAFPMGAGPAKPEAVKNSADVVAWYDKAFAEAIARVKAMTGEQLAKPVNFFNMFNYPAIVYLNFNVVHVIHHRGQLSVYLRPMGAKVPSIYGPSADEGVPKPVSANA